ncbi:hypothetical protein ACPA2M_25285 [Ectopseudomonas chengduensis]
MSPSTCSWGICLVLAGAFAASQAQPLGPQVLEVELFVELPSGVRYPEGLASNPRNGDIYVGTFDMRQPASERNNQLLRYAADGRLLAQRSFAGMPLTGLGYADGQLYILNFGAGKLQRILADFTADTPGGRCARFPPARSASPGGSHGGQPGRQPGPDRVRCQWHACSQRPGIRRQW